MPELHSTELHSTRLPSTRIPSTRLRREPPLITSIIYQGADFIIAVAIVYHLNKARATSTFAETNSLLTRVIWGTLETNAGIFCPRYVCTPLHPKQGLTFGSRFEATAVVALVDAVLFSALTTTNYHIITNLVLVKL